MVYIIITGTPGVGKSSVAKELSRKIGAEILDLHDLARRCKAIEEYDIEAKSMVYDVRKIKKALKDIGKETLYILDSHLAHFAPPELTTFCFVLRVHPKHIEKRLKRRAYHEKKIEDNKMVEKLDTCLIEAIEEGHEKHLYEIDTTNKSIKKIVSEIIKIMKKKPKPRYGNVKWLK